MFTSLQQGGRSDDGTAPRQRLQPSGASQPRETQYIHERREHVDGGAHAAENLEAGVAKVGLAPLQARARV